MQGKKKHHSELLWTMFAAALLPFGGRAVAWPSVRYGQRNRLLKFIEEAIPMDVRNSHPESFRLFVSALLALNGGTSQTTLGDVAGHARSKFKVESAANVARTAIAHLAGTPDAKLPAADHERAAKNAWDGWAKDHLAIVVVGD